EKFDGISKEEAMNLYVDIVEIANIGWNKSIVIDDSENIEENIEKRRTYISTMSYEDCDNFARNNVDITIKDKEGLTALEQYDEEFKQLVIQD
ncbi:6914_t:CDS:2, partial [Diversispora eburnea]